MITLSCQQEALLRQSDGQTLITCAGDLKEQHRRH